MDGEGWLQKTGRAGGHGRGADAASPLEDNARNTACCGHNGEQRMALAQGKTDPQWSSLMPPVSRMAPVVPHHY